jgi:heme/copper-type cytochrome/quinol oxidase subunit 3
MLRISVYGSPYVYGIKQDNTSPVKHMLQCLIYSVLVLGISLDYNKDSIRESISSYDIVSYQMLCLLLIFILSENMFIMTNLWSSISAVYSSSTTTYNQIIQDHIIQVTNELTSTNTVLLSNCSLSLGSIFQINDTHLLGYHIIIVSSILISHLFISCQIKEYQYLSLLMNESLTTSEFFILIGIHLCHVIVGNILITIYL